MTAYDKISRLIEKLSRAYNERCDRDYMERYAGPNQTDA